MLEKKYCNLECIWNHEKQVCDGCGRTKQEIAQAGRDKQRLDELTKEKYYDKQ